MSTKTKKPIQHKPKYIRDMEENTQYEHITPHKAMKLLEKLYDGQRLLNQGWIQSLARQMTEGAWKDDGTPIQIDVCGQVINGQHRLWAIAESNIPQWCNIVRNVPTEGYHTIDTNLNRNVKVALRFQGEERLAVLAPSLSWKASYLNKGIGPNKHYSNISHSGKLTNNEMLLLLDKYPTLRVACVKSNGAKIYGAKGMFAWLWHEFDTIAPAECYEFFYKLIKGVDLSERSVMHTLHKRLTDNRIAMAQQKVGYWGPERIAYACVMCWNTLRAGKNRISVKSLRWAKSNGDSVKFPEIR